MKKSLLLNNLLLPTVMLLAAISSTSCKSSKQIQNVIQGTDSVTTAGKMKDVAEDNAASLKRISEKVLEQQIDFEWFASKVKVDYTDIYKKNTNATAFIKIKKDSLIWVSLTGALGIEGFRAMLTPDSVVVMDKLEKSVARRSITSIQDIINLPVNFAAVQDLLIGNIVFFTGDISSYRSVDDKLLVLSIGEFFKHLITIDSTTNTLVSSKLDDIDEYRNRTAFIKYSNYEQQSGKKFSTVREVSVAEKSKLDIKLEFKQYEFDQPQTFPFNIPKSYREK